jgi:capsular polysaccharide biosynthesis protein
LHLPFESSQFTGIVQLICNRLGIDAEIRVRRFADVAYVPRGIYLSSVAQHNTRKSATFMELRSVFVSRLATSAPPLPARRLYVSRRESEIRHIVNRTEVEELFSRHGFQTVYPSDFTFSAQVRIFHEATHIAGPLGAGLANVAWASEGAKVLMIDPGLVDFYFWDLAGQVGHQFYWHLAGVPRPYTTAMELDPYSVDCQSLEATIITMLRE